MEVILLERVAKLGQMGEVVRVKHGFARNYLWRKGKALRASEANRARFETMKIDLEARNLQQRGEAEKVAEKLNGQSFTVLRQAAEGGQLYGSVSGRDVADAVNAGGGKVDRAMVILDRPIKTLGVHAVRVRLHPEVTITVNVNIARSQDEAERQSRGEDVIASQFEEDRAVGQEAMADLLEGGAGQQAPEHEEY